MGHKLSKKSFFNIFMLGLVSLFTDISSEMILPLIPLFIVSLGGGGLIVGLAGGLGESVSSLLKVVSGHISDRLGMRKRLVVLGYGISTIAKMFFPLATAGYQVVLIRVGERLGKGIRTAPRDALVAAYTEEGARGKGFGIHRAMDTIGAVIGSLLAFTLIWVLSTDIRLVFLVGALLALPSFVPLYFVQESTSSPIRKGLREELLDIPPPLKKFITVATIFALGNISIMFFIMRASLEFEGKLSIAAPVLLYVLFNISYAFFSVPVGTLSDKVGRKRVLLAGYLTFALTSVGFALDLGVLFLILLFISYGLAFAMVDTMERAYSSDLSHAAERGMALGALHTSVGVAALPASVIAGILWDSISYSAAFVWAAGVAICAVILLARLSEPPHTVSSKTI
ncbi:MAG: MFS transporter [Methermicoccaceae archaeon]